MNGLQKLGGVAAWIEASTFVAGFVVFFALLVPAGYFSGDADPVQNAAFVTDNRTVLHLWYMTIYIVFGLFLVVLTLALYERLKSDARALMQIATAFGLIWAVLVIASGMIANVGLRIVVDLHAVDPSTAASLWLALNSVVTGLGGGNEIVGGLWLLLVSYAGMRTQKLSRGLSRFGLLIGACGVLQTLVPIVEALGALFGLGLIVWFIALGVVMLREKPNARVIRNQLGSDHA